MRATWKGHLQLALVSIPIKLFPATDSAGALSFNQLHASCHTRLQQKRWCPTCATEIAAGDTVKGYEVERGRFVVLSDAELEAAKPPSTRVIALTRFADARGLDLMTIDRAYYLAPDGRTAAEAFAVLRAAIAGVVGIGTLALYGREYLIAVGAKENGLVLYTLHHPAECRPIADVPELDTLPQPADQPVALAKRLVAASTRPFDVSDFRDAYRDAVQAVIDAKIAGKAIVTPQVPAPAVLELRNALTRSLEALRATAKKKRAKRRHAA